METPAIDISTFLTILTNAVKVSDVLTLLGSVVGVGLSCTVMWFGVRKAYKIFMSALQGRNARI